MPTFQLGRCSIELCFEPLTGSLAPADRQLAWRVYVALQLRPGLHGNEGSATALHDLLSSLEAWLADWPAAEIERPDVRQLGHALAAVAELVLRPCLQAGGTASSWPAVRTFLHDLGRELARAYRFPDAGLKVPADLQAEWRDAAGAPR